MSMQSNTLFGDKEMPRMRTHYDNLKVSQDAPREVIRAAYKALSQKHHPDKNGNSEKSVRIMKIINESYEVLSNTESRKRHDEQIAAQGANATGERPKKDQDKQPSNRSNEAPAGYVTLAHFSSAKGIPEAKVIEMIRDGFYTGRKVGEHWFVSTDEIGNTRTHSRNHRERNGSDTRYNHKAATNEYIPVSKFSQVTGIAESKVIEMIRDGFYVGIIKKGEWFVSGDELERNHSAQKSHRHGYEFRWWHLWVLIFFIKAIALVQR